MEQIGQKIAGGTVIRAEEVRAGDIISETDDQQAWYRVTRDTAKSYWVTPVDPAYPLETRFGKRHSAIVLRRDV